MKDTNKNHKRRNNKKRQTKKYKGVGVGGGLWDTITSRVTGKSSDGNSTDLNASGNSTDLNAEANNLFKQLDTSKDGNLSMEEYTKANIPNMPDFKTVAGDDNKIDLYEFTTAYYFAKANEPGPSGNVDDKLNKGEYANLQGLLPGAEKIDFTVVSQGDDKIEFHELLPLCYFLKAAGPNAKIDGGGDGDEYKEVELMLPGAAKIPYEQVDKNDNGIEFGEFLPLYYFLKAAGSDAKISNGDEYKEVKLMLPGAAKIPYEQVDKNGNGIEFDEFLPLYYFAKVNEPDDTLSADEYGKAKLMLENMKKMPDFGEVDGDNSGTIDFKEFLTAYNNAKQSGGRRRRKRSTRNKRKTNKKRRTVKRRKSAKRSHRRK